MKFLAQFFGFMLGMTALDYIKPRSRITFRVALGLACLLLAVVNMEGCAMLPIPFQPANEQYNSNMAEGAWLVLDAVDTAQTMHIRANNPTCSYEADPLARAVYGGREPSPSRVLLTNLALATVHTMVTSWLDDEVAKHDLANDGSVGPWYVGRIAWHTVSIVVSGASVINNHRNGCAL